MLGKVRGSKMLIIKHNGYISLLYQPLALFPPFFDAASNGLEAEVYVVVHIVEILLAHSMTVIALYWGGQNHKC